MTADYTAKPTNYAGIRFRSRTEARWAMLFDVLQLKWKYEPKSFKLPTYWYIPDFWLPKLKAWVEVKGSHAQWNKRCETKAVELVKITKQPLLICEELALIVRVRVPDATLLCGFEDYYCNLPQSAERGRIWVTEYSSAGIDPELVVKVEGIRRKSFR